MTVVVDGRPTLTTEGHVGAYPSKIPMIDVVTVGAGGGSIAWISPEGTLKVGPHSAGADPGPMCYRTGGVEPTITDAHLLLGRIPPHLLGGEVPLDPDTARSGLEKLALDLGLSLEACATGVLEISAWNQANALRQITVNRGLDVRDFTLVTFGGSGSCWPAGSWTCSACAACWSRSTPATCRPTGCSPWTCATTTCRPRWRGRPRWRPPRSRPGSTTSPPRPTRRWRARASRGGAGVPPHGRRPLLRPGLRGARRRARGPVDEQTFAAVAQAFHDEHAVLYGYDFRTDRQEVEWVNLRVTGVGPIRKPEVREVAAGTGAEQARRGSRQVYFDAWVDAPVYDRARLGAGDVVEGPAVLEEFSSTVPLHPGFTARVDGYGNLVITRTTDGAAS